MAPADPSGAHPRPLERGPTPHARRGDSPAAAPSPAGGARARAMPRLTTALALAAIAIGVVHAARLAWTSDDAYISFRYARNLDQGLGLVYNAGERVEGYSNFLWTLWCALGLELGLAPESWANAWSIACFGTTIALLGALTRRRAIADAAGGIVPFAALALALDRDACVFATGGLETALFTLLAVAGYAALARLGEQPLRGSTESDGSPGAATARGAAPAPGAARLSSPGGDVRRAGIAGILLALASLARPDGVIFGALGAVYVIAVARPRLRAALAYGAALAAIGVPYALWKFAYYGDLLPNTYYAKSAGLAWWDQGFAYVGLYFRKYWVLAAGPVVALARAAWGAWRMRRPGADDPARESARRATGPALLATAFAVVYTLYVARVGGDFMFARLLIPATPFFALAFELGLGPRGVRWRGLPHAAAAAIALVLIAAWPNPFKGEGWVRGIVDERLYYLHEGRDADRRVAAELEQLTRGLAVRGVISGKQAMIAYGSRMPVVIEASTGLTDAFIAHRKLERRGRVGHEKNAPFAYLIETRRAHFCLGQSRILSDTLRAYIPLLFLRYKSVAATLLNWDPPVMEAMRRRGAECDDFTVYLDRFIRDMPRVPDAVVADVYAKSRRFYFDGVRDSVREAPFRARLRL